MNSEASSTIAVVDGQLAADLERRRERLCQAMAREGVEALVSSQTSAWTEYVTGLPRLGRPPQPDEVGNSCWLLRDGRVVVTLVHSNWKLELEPRLAGLPYDVREVTAPGRAATLRDAVGTIARAWVDEATTFVEFAALRNAFPETQFDLVPAAAWAVRAAKSAYEIERMRAAARATERAYLALAASLPDRFTVADLLAECDHRLEQEGILRPAVVTNAYVLGESSSLEWGWTREQARRYLVQPPSVVTLDGGARVDGYAADVGRTFIVGEALPAWERAYDTAWRAQAALVHALRPDVATADLDALAREIVEEAGLGPTFWIPSGHALGLDVHEPPRLAATDDSVVREGMTLSLEIGLWDRSAIGVAVGAAAFVEDTAVVRAEGAELFTTSPVRRCPLAEAQANTARVVEKAVAVLDALAGDAEEVGVSELGRRLGFGKSTTHRLLATLRQHDLVRVNPVTRKYRLGFGVLRFSAALLQQFDIRGEALPHLRSLRDRTGETASLVIRQDVERIHLEQVKGLHELAFSLDVGSRVPIFVGAAGKALTAWLSEADLDELIRRAALPAYTEWSITDRDALLRELDLTRTRGFAVGVSERFSDVVSVAAPVRDFQGAVIAALNVAGAASRLPVERALELGPLLAQEARSLSESLGWHARAA